VDEPVPCLDPECAEKGGMAEPESDGELRFYACTTCGYEGNYQMVRQSSDACSLGIPEEVRRAASFDPRQDRPSAGQPVFLGTTIGRRPG
jgi:hypothetical protein